MTPVTLPAGVLRRIYVDRTELVPGGTPIRILEGDVKTPIEAREVEFSGSARLVFDPKHPLWSDAKLWVETSAELFLY